MTDFGDLSTTELAKQINDEYSVILEAERTNLQKAMAIGEKLIALRRRIAPEHGDWQAKLKLYCPQISYETATRYIRLSDKREELDKAAAAKSVATTDLTIEEARKLLSKPTTKGNSGSGGKPNNIVKDLKKQIDGFIAEWPNLNEWQKNFFVKTYRDEIVKVLEEIKSRAGVVPAPQSANGAISGT